MFLGKIGLSYNGKRFGVKPDRKLAMLPLGPDDPAGVFLADSSGNDWFLLQCHTGDWVQFVTENQNRNQYFPVLTGALVGSRGYSTTQFTQQLLSFAEQKAKLGFMNMDSLAAAAADSAAPSPKPSDEVNQDLQAAPLGAISLSVLRSINPKCDCDFDVGPGWGLAGTQFEMVVLTPGIAQIQKTKSAKGADFGCVGKACIDLSGVAFDGIDFSQSIFHRTSLRNVRFSNCNLDGARFEGADLTNADFSQTSVAGADFTGQDFTKNGVRLPTPPFSNSVAKRTIFRNAKLAVASLGRNWSYIDLTDATIVGLDNFDFNGLVAQYSVLPRLKLSGLELRDVDFSYSDLSGSSFSLASLRSAKMQFAKLWSCDFTRANLYEPDFTGALLGGVDGKSAASFTWAYIQMARLDKANLFGVGFSQAMLFGAGTSITETVTMEQVDFSNAYLAGVNLVGANLKGAKFNRACLVNVNLSQSDLRPTTGGNFASLAGAVLQGAKFEGAKLDGADLSNAAVSFDRGRIPVSYCNDQHIQTSPTNVPYVETLIDPDNVDGNTRCPNGHTYATNQEKSIDWEQMMTSKSAPQAWAPGSCGPLAVETAD
jgi:uncharacterized protein YjbI with pentapeptide repeats